MYNLAILKVFNIINLPLKSCYFSRSDRNKAHDMLTGGKLWIHATYHPCHLHLEGSSIDVPAGTLVGHHIRPAHHLHCPPST